MNNKILSKKKIISLFLSIILVTGTIAISYSISSSFMINAQAQPSYYYDSGLDNNNYEKSYGKDNYKSKESIAVSLNKIKCIDNNININGENTGNVNIGNKGQISATEEGYSDAYSYSSGHGETNNGYDKKNRGFDCIINNNNTNINFGGNQTIPTTLTVKKEIFGCNIFDVDGNMDCQTLQNDSPLWLPCTNSIISTSIFCLSLPANLFDIEILDEQNNQVAQFKGSEQGTTIENLEPGTYTINEIKHQGNNNQLGLDPDAVQGCTTGAGFDDGGTLFNSSASILYESICFKYEDEQGNDCSTVAVAAGEEKTCTVKNYIRETLRIMS